VLVAGGECGDAVFEVEEFDGRGGDAGDAGDDLLVAEFEVREGLGGERWGVLLRLLLPLLALRLARCAASASGFCASSFAYRATSAFTCVNVKPNPSFADDDGPALFRLPAREVGVEALLPATPPADAKASSRSSRLCRSPSPFKKADTSALVTLRLRSLSMAENSSDARPLVACKCAASRHHTDCSCSASPRQLRTPPDPELPTLLLLILLDERP